MRRDQVPTCTEYKRIVQGHSCYYSFVCCIVLVQPGIPSIRSANQSTKTGAQQKNRSVRLKCCAVLCSSLYTLNRQGTWMYISLLGLGLRTGRTGSRTMTGRYDSLGTRYLCTCTGQQHAWKASRWLSASMMQVSAVHTADTCRATAFPANKPRPTRRWDSAPGTSTPAATGVCTRAQVP